MSGLHNTNISSAVIPKLFNEIGFAWTMRAVAITYLILLIIANFTVTSKVKHQPKPLSLHEFAQPLKNRAVLMLAIASILFFSGVFLPYDFLVLQCRYSGMSQSMAIYTLTILNGTR